MQKRKWWIVPVMMGVGVLLGLFGAAAVSYLMPKLYQSITVLQVRPSLPEVQGGEALTVPPSAEEGADFATGQIREITSTETLDEVITRLDLENHWNMERPAVHEQLRGMIAVENIRGTDLIEIRVRAANPSDAKMIADSVATVYRIRRTEMENERKDRAFEELREAVRKQEKVVEEKMEGSDQVH